MPSASRLASCSLSLRAGRLRNRLAGWVAIGIRFSAADGSRRDDSACGRLGRYWKRFRCSRPLRWRRGPARLAASLRRLNQRADSPAGNPLADLHRLPVVPAVLPPATAIDSRFPTGPTNLAESKATLMSRTSPTNSSPRLRRTSIRSNTSAVRMIARGFST